MRSSGRIIGVAAALVAGASIAALSQTDSSHSGGTTVIRGDAPAPAAGAEVGGGSGNPAVPRGGAIDRSGEFNALHSGSANAGGVIANPPPGLAGQGGAGAVDQSGDFNALHSGSANAGGIIANPPPGLAGR